MTKKINPIRIFCYTGTDKTGKKIAGEIKARTVTLAKVDLLQQEIVIQKIVPKRTPLFYRRNKRITPADIALFCRQLATMIESGIPIIQSFNVLAQGQTNQRMRSLIDNIKNDVATGFTLSEALQKRPAYFNQLVCHLVAAGEQSGTLDIMLDKIATYKEKIETIKKKIKKTLTYPIALLSIAFIVTACMLIFVVPQFEALFKGFGAELPASTQALIFFSHLFQSYWYLLFSFIGVASYLLIHAQNRYPYFAHRIDRITLKMPLFGTVIKKAIIARFARTLSITFAAGLPLVDSLHSVAGAAGNSVFYQATVQIKEEISSGKPINKAMENTNLFPEMVIQMIAVGEESGTLDKMLRKVADFYEEEVENAVDSLSSLLEPVIMSLLGIIVGGLVIAMYLPIFKLGSAI